MNSLEQQARSFFLRCRARSWPPRPLCKPCGFRCIPQRAFASTLFDSPTAEDPASDYAQPLQSDPASDKAQPLRSYPPPPSTKPYYVTTPIYYVNAEPHIGHLYSLVLADVLKRWDNFAGSRDARLLTGTDEHGMKVQKAAEKAKMDTGVFCAMNAQKFRNLADKANISYDRFMRTTDNDHKAAVEYFFSQLQQRGYIYKSKHEGWYCVSDETFYPELQVHMIIEPQTGRKIYASKETGKEVQWTSEDNYHFRLSDFRDRLLKHYNDYPYFIVPRQRMNFIVKEVEGGLTDLSVSRPASRLQWGIRVPGDESQTIYVWLDALINYITMAGYPFVTDHPNQNIWPPECQVIGKDIIRFHCIYWPAFLMALDLPVTEQFLSHAHWTMNEEKMSKSLGNVVNPFHAIDRFGVDTIRYYMVRDGGYADDAAYENSFIVERYRKELQGGLGNLLSRVIRGKQWNVRESIESMQPLLDHKDPRDLPKPFAARKALITDLVLSAKYHMKRANPRMALYHIMQIIVMMNKFFQEAEPWHKADSSDMETQHELKNIIYVTADSIRVACILLQPFMPEKMKTALDMLGVRDEARHWGRARLGVDFKYGIPRMELGKSGIPVETLFPPLNSNY